MTVWERQTWIFRRPLGIFGLVILALVLFKDIPKWMEAARQGRAQAIGGGAGAPLGGKSSLPKGAISLPNFPEPGPPQAIEPGIVMHDIALGPKPAPRGSAPGHSGQLWLYLPEGDHAPGSLPCVLIAPAGTSLLTGIGLADGDRAEHLPWVRAGFAVMAYDLDGHRPEDNNGAKFEEAVDGFFRARAGLVNAHIALEYCAGEGAAGRPEPALRRRA